MIWNAPKHVQNKIADMIVESYKYDKIARGLLIEAKRKTEEQIDRYYPLQKSHV
jgi:hypothetical protein